MTTERGSSKGGEKKAPHRFSKAVPESKGYGMEQFMKESQGPRGSAPWTPVGFSKPGGGQKKG